MAVQIERLPVFFKQRDNYFFPAWTFVIPTTIMRLPVSFVESLVYTAITYFEIDLAPTAGRWVICTPLVPLQGSPFSPPALKFACMWCKCFVEVYMIFIEV